MSSIELKKFKKLYLILNVLNTKANMLSGLGPFPSITHDSTNSHCQRINKQKASAAVCCAAVVPTRNPKHVI